MSFSNEFKSKTGQRIEAQLLKSIKAIRESLANPAPYREPVTIIPPALYDELRGLGIISPDGRIDISNL